MPVAPLILRLREYQGKRFKKDESYYIINDFLLTPYLPSLIETLNKVHRVKVCRPDNQVTALKLQFERDKKPGIWNAIKRFFSRYETVVMIWHNGQLFLCEYYKHSFFEMCDKIKIDYDEKLKPTFGSDFVVVCRAK
jgi:hypothetical protein